MKQKLITMLAAAACLMAAPFAAQSAEIQVWGSTTCQKRFLEPGAEAFHQATGNTIKVLGVGTGKGMMALIEGKTKVAAASSSLESAIKSAKKAAKKAGKTLTIPANLQFHEIARDSIVPIVHTSNPVEALTWQQLADLNTGRVTNWKEVGGPDLPVVVVTSHAGSATRAVFQKLVMKKAEYAPNAIIVRSTRLEINEVSREPGAIGAVSEGFWKLNPGNTKVVKTDPIQRPLALITLGPPTPEVQQLIDFFRTGEGKKHFE